MIIFPLAISNSLVCLFPTNECVNPAAAISDDVSAVVLDANDAVYAEKFCDQEDLPRFSIDVDIPGYIRINKGDVKKVLVAAQNFEASYLPPFVNALIQYTAGLHTSFATPGHHGGEFYRHTRTGRLFYHFLGPNVFRADISSSDSYMGDILLHEGMAEAAEKHAAKVFHADATYFVLNGTSAANKVCTNALLTDGDVVLFDRNNHKSVHHGALIQANAIPLYLETTRNPYGFIGGMPAHCLQEDELRRKLATIAPEKAQDKRPFRLAVFQLGTYDGILYNAADILRQVGHLCDYILFDCAWVGYEQFIPFLADMSPLTLDLDENSPGILVTQSVHKQLAGFSQTSQIHKKDFHLKGQARYITHDRFNNAFLQYASTSPNYPLFASLDMNASLHEDGRGEEIWYEACRLATEAKKEMLRRLRYFRPFVPDKVDGIPWEDIPTEKILSDRHYFAVDPDADWHGFIGFGEGQYCLDPCKILLYTPGINIEDWSYRDFGIPATIVSKYLQINQMTPEKNDLNSLLFLITPAETEEKLKRLIDLLAALEDAIDRDVPMRELLAPIVEANEEVYANYTIRRLCAEMHGFYKEHHVNLMQKIIFEADNLPPIAMTPKEADTAFARGKCEKVAIRDIEGRIALEGALPYPPGIITMVPGERWTAPVRRYFLALEEAMHALPGFAPEIQGVHRRTTPTGELEFYAYVYRDN